MAPRPDDGKARSGRHLLRLRLAALGQRVPAQHHRDARAQGPLGRGEANGARRHGAADVRPRMSIVDRYGLTLTTTSSAARDAYVDGVDRLLGAQPAAEASFARALEIDPGL